RCLVGSEMCIRDRVDPQKCHGVKAAAPSPALAQKNGKLEPAAPKPTYTDVFGAMAARLAAEDPRVVAVTAALGEGTGLVSFSREHPDRFFDVGIAEAHGVTFCAGLAAQGMRPIAAIYSTFLQRAYDQILHDVALQHLPVLFAIDRAGLVGEDGPTHHGDFDLSYLSCVPGMVIAAPRDARSLCALLRTGLAHDSGPFAVRYPRDTIPDSLGIDALLDLPPERIPIGSWEVLRPGDSLVLLAIGSMIPAALACAEQLEAVVDGVGVIDARFLKPLDEELLASVLARAGRIVTLEENSVRGGLGAAVATFAQERGAKVPMLHLGLPDAFVEHGRRALLLDRVGLSEQAVHGRIVEWILSGSSLTPRTDPIPR
ncbi:MAG: transketolase C-terminal domain-containing protein, partial [Candidatus Eisenbacteria bacterium]|nr:transketolase C-terminal domain-containing protein [Candidatus Eisenbacteria bacterium]